MKRLTLTALLLCFMAAAAFAAVARTGGRDVAAGTSDYWIDFGNQRSRNISINPISADIKIILHGSTGVGGTNDTITVPAGVILNATVDISKIRVDRTSSTRVVHFWSTP